jgi:molybdopterin-guanine dinucleotide biosynthesis protein A
MGGVYTALTTTRKEAVLFLACDAPFVSVQLLDRLVEKFQTARGAWFVAHQGRVGFPFLLPTRCLRFVARQLERGEYSLQSLAVEVKAKRFSLPRSLRLQLENVNTPEEWECARRLWRKRRKAAPAHSARHRKSSAS